MGEDFAGVYPDVKVTVNRSGTGSGFQKFLRADIDIAAASRSIDPNEDAALRAKHIAYIEIPIAYDGVSVIVNPQNTWADKLTLSELARAWTSRSTVRYWSDIRPSFPRERVSFYGPTDNHGTYEYFTEAIMRRKNDLREDCQKNQEYNAVIQAVSTDKDALAYVGFNYFDENKQKVRAVPIDSGNGGVEPSSETIANGSYSPLSRPLFLYVSKRSYDTKPQVKAFVWFVLGDRGEQAIADSKYVSLPKALRANVAQNVMAEKTGTFFASVRPGSRLDDLYSRVAHD